MNNTPETDDHNQEQAIRAYTLDFCRKLERERDEARKDSIFWQSLAEGRGRTNDDCSVCGGCFMIPGTEPNDDVMNTPCPKCNSQHYTPLPADPRHASFVQTKQ